MTWLQGTSKSLYFGAAFSSLPSHYTLIASHFTNSAVITVRWWAYVFLLLSLFLSHPLKMFSSIGKKLKHALFDRFSFGKFTIYRICTYTWWKYFNWKRIYANNLKWFTRQSENRNYMTAEHFWCIFFLPSSSSLSLSLSFNNSNFTLNRMYCTTTSEAWGWGTPTRPSKMLGHKDVNFVELCDIFEQVKSSEMYFCVGMKHALNELLFVFDLHTDDNSHLNSFPIHKRLSLLYHYLM